MEDFVVLVDIGNTNFHIWDNGKIYDLKSPEKFKDEIYYISVNETKEKKFLQKNPKAFNLKEFAVLDTSYTLLGIDRIMACKAVNDGIVVDAGSAITVDVMQNGIHLGGIIMPGINAFKQAYGKISDKLKLDFCEVDFAKLPQNTQEAISFGSIGAVILMINKLKRNKKVYFTGGDGKFFAKYIDGIYIKDLVFRGMLLTIKEMERL
jgi:type III pantothenate kinase